VFDGYYAILTLNILRSVYVFHLYVLYGPRKERKILFPPYKTLIGRILQYSRSVFIANKGLNFSYNLGHS
jgi:hypothetical protein